jgi:hypothetical protein
LHIHKFSAAILSSIAFQPELDFSIEAGNRRPRTVRAIDAVLHACAGGDGVRVSSTHERSEEEKP